MSKTTESVVLESNAVSNVALSIFTTLWGKRSKLVSFFGKSLDEQIQQVKDASNQYRNKYIMRYGKLKVLGMTQLVDLESVYTDVQFLDEQHSQHDDSLQNLEQLFCKSKLRNFQALKSSKKAGIEFANNTQYLMVLGHPGSGKSTFLRKVGLDALQGESEFERDCIPVLIELKEFITSEIEIKQVILKEFESCGFPSADKFVQKALDQGKLLILLDGLNEVPLANQHQVLEQIRDFVERYDQNCYICSCRLEYQLQLERFTNGVLAFDEVQIQQFIFKWFQLEPDQNTSIAQRCWELLRKPENAVAQELAKTPLWLTFLCSFYSRSPGFLKNQADLYQDALDVWLRKWVEEKRTKQSEYQNFNVALEHLLLSEIAYKGFEANRTFFSKQEVLEQIKSFLASNPGAFADLDSETILKAISVQQGILVKQSNRSATLLQDAYSFSHFPLLQEYLTAQYIARNNNINQLVTAHLTNPRWRAVFLLVAGLVQVRHGADELLLLMDKAASQYINTSKLQSLLRWVNHVTIGAGDFNPAAQRAVAIYLARYPAPNTENLDLVRAFIRALDPSLDHALSHALDRGFDRTFAFANPSAHPRALALDVTCNRIREFVAIKIFKNVNWTVLIEQLQAIQLQVLDGQSDEVERASDRIVATWCNALGLDPELVELSETETKALEDYLATYLFIVQCQQAAVWVSPKVWTSIESRMFSYS